MTAPAQGRARALSSPACRPGTHLSSAGTTASGSAAAKAAAVRAAAARTTALPCPAAAAMPGRSAASGSRSSGAAAGAVARSTASVSSSACPPTRAAIGAAPEATPGQAVHALCVADGERFAPPSQVHGKGSHRGMNSALQACRWAPRSPLLHD